MSATSGPTQSESVKPERLKVIAWIVLFFLRTIAGVLFFGTPCLLAYAIWRGWPRSAFGLLVGAFLIAVEFGLIKLYMWADDNVNHKDE